jgi:uncharacterized membrane protein
MHGLTRRGAAHAPVTAVLAFAIVPVLFHLVIVTTRHAHFESATGLFRAGFVTASAISHWGIYASLLVMFGSTLRPGREPLITAMARRMHGELSDEITRYTVKGTWAWCCFFAFQLTMSVSLFCFAPLDWWSFFVNVMDIPMVVTMFSVEYLIRLRVLRDPPRHSFAAILEMITNPSGKADAKPLLPARMAAPD